MKKKNVDRSDALCFRVACVPIWENSPLVCALLCGASICRSDVFQNVIQFCGGGILEFALATIINWL